MFALNMARMPCTASRSHAAWDVADQPALIEEGEGWVAEEAFAVGLYAVLATAPDSTGSGAPEDHFRAAVGLAVNHSGDSDSTGSIAGNILGAYYGEACLPAAWLEQLEAPHVIRGMADMLVGVTTA